MTTHYHGRGGYSMSDRKAILSKGRLKCVGSSLFLKQKFGVGYHLTIELNRRNDVDEKLSQYLKKSLLWSSKEILKLESLIN